MNLLTNEQIAYLKSLDSKEKRREFLLDCLIGNITAQEVDFEIPINYGKFENDGTGFNTTTAPRTFTETLNKIRQYYEKDLNFNEEISEAIDKMILKNEPLKFDAKEEDGCIKASGLPYESRHISYEQYLKWLNETYNPKGEESKWDKNPKLEDVIKSKLLIRGFKNEDLLNNRGLIGATIDETVIEVVKNYRFANENTEAKFTKEDIKNAYLTAIVDYLKADIPKNPFNSQESVEKYLKKIKNDKSAN